MATCTECGAKAAFLSALCYPCMGMARGILDDDQLREQSGQLARARAEEELMISSIVLTTAPSIEGMRVTRTIDVITAECVFGMNLFKDIFASFTDVFGGRSESSQKVLRDARKACLSELRKEALLVGANAVIGIDLDYSEFSGGGKSMLFLVASGTAVATEPLKHGA